MYRTAYIFRCFLLQKMLRKLFLKKSLNQKKSFFSIYYINQKNPYFTFLVSPFWKCQVLINLELPKTVSHFSGILHVSHPTLTNWSFFNSVQFSLLYYYYTTVLLLVAPKKNIVVWCINFPLISINYAYLIIEKQDNCQETCVWSKQAGSIRIICTIMLVVVVCTTATMLYCIE